MGPVSVSYTPTTGGLRVPGAAREVARLADGLHGRLADLSEASLVSLARSVNAARRPGEDVLRVWLHDVVPDEFWPDVAPLSPVRLVFFGDQLRVEVETHRPATATERPPLQRALTPLLHRDGASLTAIKSGEAFGTESIVLVFTPHELRTKRVATVFYLALRARQLADTVLARGALDAEAVVDLVHADAELLIGQRESGIFDAKSQPYHLDDDDGKFELAKDVAAFANTGRPAAIVVGLRTRPDHQGDLVAAVPRVARESAPPSRIRSLLNSWVYPPPRGVSVRWHGDTRGLLTILVPAQPSELEPFFVRRARLGRGLTAEHMTLPVREDEETVYRDIGRVHALIVAGRAALAATPADPPTL